MFVFPIKCFYILWNGLLQGSLHKMFFNILGNCYKMVHSSVHPIKCFYILGNCYPMYSMVHHLSIRRYTNYKNVCQHVYQIYSQTLTHCNTCCYPRVRNTMEHVINKLTMVGTTTFLRCRF